MKFPQTFLLFWIFGLDGVFYIEVCKLWCKENIIPVFLLWSISELENPFLTIWAVPGKSWAHCK